MGQLVTLLLLVGYVVAYFKWIAAAVVAYLAYRWGRVAWIRRCAAADAWEHEIAQRTSEEQQHRPVPPGQRTPSLPTCDLHLAQR